MPCRCLSAVVAVLCLAGGRARADGLIFSLPADGTWAKYAVQTEAEARVGELPARRFSFASTFTIRSVGEVTRHEQPCRWIELKLENEAEGPYRKLVLKMLLPEEVLKRGEDPLSHPLKTFFNPKPVDKRAPAVESYIDEGFNRIEYEINRFRTVFPRPLDDVKALGSKTIRTKAGEFEGCEVIGGRSRYDGPMLDDGRLVFDGTYEIALHRGSPFGVVALQAVLDGREYSRVMASIKTVMTLILIETGTDATSELGQEPAGKRSGRP